MVDWVLDSSPTSREIDEVHVVTNAGFADDVRALGREPRGRHRPRRRHDARTRTGSARSATSGSSLDRGRPRRRRPARDRRRQPLRVLARRTTSRSGGRRAASAIAVHDVGDLGSRRRYGVVELDADDRSSDFEEKPEHPRIDLVATATYLFSREHLPLARRATSTREPARPARPLRRVALRARARLRLPLRRATGSTSATPASCSRPTTASRLPGCPREPRTSPDPWHIRHRADTDTSRFGRTVDGWLLDLVLPAALRLPAAPGTARSATLPRPARPDRAAALRPLRSADRLARRALPRVLGAPARLRVGARRGRVRRGRAGRSSRGWKERGLRPLADRAAELVAERCRGRRPTSSRSSRRTATGASSAATIRRERLARELGAPLGDRGARRSSRRAQAGRRQRGLSLAERRRNVRGAFSAPAGRRRGRARRRRLHDRRHRDAARGASAAGAAVSTWSRSRVPFDAGDRLTRGRSARRAQTDARRTPALR